MLRSAPQRLASLRSDSPNILHESRPGARRARLLVATTSTAAPLGRDAGQHAASRDTAWSPYDSCCLSHRKVELRRTAATKSSHCLFVRSNAVPILKHTRKVSSAGRRLNSAALPPTKASLIAQLKRTFTGRILPL